MFISAAYVECLHIKIVIQILNLDNYCTPIYFFISKKPRGGNIYWNWTRQQAWILLDGNIAAPIFGGVYLVTVATQVDTFALIVFWNPYKKARPRLRNICWWGFLRAYLKAVQIHIFVETWNNKLIHNTSLIGILCK